MPGLMNLKLDLPAGLYFPGRHSFSSSPPSFASIDDHVGHGQTEKCSTAGCKALMDLQAPFNLNKEHVACALAKLSFTKMALI